MKEMNTGFKILIVLIIGVLFMIGFITTSIYCGVYKPQYKQQLYENTRYNANITKYVGITGDGRDVIIFHHWIAI
jgi:hypothetical protein